MNISHCSKTTSLVSQTIYVLCLIGALVSTPANANGDYETWKEAQLADAMRAAPPSVTHDASFYAWDENSRMIVIKHGTGPHHCVASGHFTTRIGLPASAIPDPACYDPNAWAFFKRIYEEKNPMKPATPYPTAPGLVWMLAGMGVPEGVVRKGSDDTASFEVDTSGKKVARLSPHIMIVPLPVNGKGSMLPFQYNPDNPKGSWVMAPETKLEHVMFHLSEEDVASMMSAPSN